MAHKKGASSSRNGRDSNAQRLGVKLFDGQLAKGGAIIVRQRGTKFHPGENVGRAGDDSLFALTTGKVQKRGSGQEIVLDLPMDDFQIIVDFLKGHDSARLQRLCIPTRNPLIRQHPLYIRFHADSNNGATGCATAVASHPDTCGGGVGGLGLRNHRRGKS